MLSMHTVVRHQMYTPFRMVGDYEKPTRPQCMKESDEKGKVMRKSTSGKNVYAY